MKFDIILTFFTAAIASSRTVIVPGGGDDAWDMSIADTAMPLLGPKILGQNTLNLCKGDHSHNAACIELWLSRSPIR